MGRASDKASRVDQASLSVWPKVEAVPEECLECDRFIPLESFIPATPATPFVDNLNDLTLSAICSGVCRVRVYPASQVHKHALAVIPPDVECDREMASERSTKTLSALRR
jgi:hypothetical protein